MNNVKEYFQNHIDKKHLTGVSYAIAFNNKDYKETLGYSDCEQTVPLKSNAIFRIASMTKPITAVAVMICKDKGLVDLDAPVGKYIKGFSHSGVGQLTDGKICCVEDAREITLRDIFTHSSGLGSGAVGSRQFSTVPKPENLYDNVMAWNGSYLDFAPGSISAYSGLVAFEIAALVVQTVTNKPYEIFLQDEIFSKLDMKDTCYCLTPEQRSRLVDMPLPDNNGNIKRVDFGSCGMNGFAEGYTGGSAGLFSTIDDYFKFAKMLSNSGELNGIRILSQNAVKEMSTPHFDTWGLSVYVRCEQNENKPLPKGSFGWSGAYGTHFWIEPQTGKTAVLMLNHANCGGAGSPFSAAFEKLVSNAEFN